MRRKSRILTAGNGHHAGASIVGIGAVSGYGWGVEPLTIGLRSGKSAVQLHKGLGEGLPESCWIARVPDGGDPLVGPTRFSRAFASAVDEAVRDAVNAGWRPGNRVGLVHATSRGDIEATQVRYAKPAVANSRRAYLESLSSTPIVLAMRRHQFTGPTMTLNAACAAGLAALVIAERLLAVNDASDVVVAATDVGVDAENLMPLAQLGALRYNKPPLEVCRPFQPGTQGFVLGEASAALVLTTSSIEGAYAQLLSGALGNDAYHPTSIEESHRVIHRVIDETLNRSEISGSDVRFYAAHGTGTPQCESADRSVLKRLGTGATAYGFKPLLGHCRGAAGLLDSVIAAKAYQTGMLPAMRPQGPAHPQLAVGPTPHGYGVTVQLAMGFGGNIAAAAFKG